MQAMSGSGRATGLLTTSDPQERPVSPPLPASSHDSFPTRQTALQWLLGTMLLFAPLFRSGRAALAVLGLSYPRRGRTVDGASTRAGTSPGS